MSEEIIRAAFREAAATNDFMPMFIATPRQVDADRGYTGWSQSELVSFLDETAVEVGYTDPYVIARDHGGPYQSRRDRGDPSIELDEAMEYAKELFERDVENGFDVLHVDATEDPRTDGPLELDEIVARTCELIEHIETTNQREQPVYYEVGTEEIVGGMTNTDDFERFIELLRHALDERGHADVFKRVVFIVGQIGTTMRIDMQNRLDPDQTEALVDIVDRHGLFLKSHFTDWLDTADLERFPQLGVGAANVGPEFAAATVEALEELEKREREAIQGTDATPSNVMSTLAERTLEDAPWEKYAPDHLHGEDLHQFGRENSRNVAVCLGRYVLHSAEVESARATLYANLDAHTDIEDPHVAVLDTVQESIHRYIEAFDLT